MELSFTPTLDPEETERRLDRLLVSGSLHHGTIAARIDRLAGAFRRYASCYPLPLWAPGLVITNEMRGLTEALLPMGEIRSVFGLVLRRGCRFEPQISGSYLQSSPSWLDLLHRLRPQLTQADPAEALREIAGDPVKRRAFLFSLMLPHHFGGGFDRYPRQSEWLAGWLLENRERLGGRLRALDSACGSGEGSYGLAELMETAGYGAGTELHGSTLEPIELFAAAHAFFPHDRQREGSYRARVAPLFRERAPVALRFYLEDVGSGTERGGYHLILCNGLLGGPLLHEEGALLRAITALAARLAPGGVLLAADRFHEGWRLRVSRGKLSAMMRDKGLVPLELPEGVGGRRPRT
jgi:SAM-dependent methyltransferase